MPPQVQNLFKIDFHHHATTASKNYVGERDRTKIPDNYKWDLTDIYASDEAWRSAKQDLVNEFAAIETFRGQVTASPLHLFRCLDLISRLGKTFNRLYCYASMHSDLVHRTGDSEGGQADD
jgi:oligoendopeptidase F